MTQEFCTSAEIVIVDILNFQEMINYCFLYNDLSGSRFNIKSYIIIIQKKKI